MSNDKIITVEELVKLTDKCLSRMKGEELYWIRNDAKMRAVYSSESYEEFRDIVDAAHLKPISKTDKNNASTKSRLWNSVVKEE